MKSDAAPDSSPNADVRLAGLAGAIAEPARARMLCCLMDGHARTATELAVVAEVAASTASAHLARLKEARLVESLAQGRHRYFRLADGDGAVALESLGLDVDAARRSRRRFACPCLDWSERRPHLGGALGAACLQLALRRGWVRQALDGRALTVTPKAEREMPELFGPSTQPLAARAAPSTHARR